jgi:hypothetical protein
MIITDNYEKDEATIMINALMFNTFILFPLAVFKLFAPNSKRVPKIRKNYTIRQNLKDFFLILLPSPRAEQILYSHDTSPFESISNYSDYELELDKMKRIYFEERGSLAIFQTVGDVYPFPFNKIINWIGLAVDKLDKLLIRSRILSGTIYLGVYRNNNKTNARV